MIERGVIRSVAYAGPVTRFEVDLEAGGRLQAVRQNSETSSAQIAEQRGQEVEVGWLPEQAVPVGDGARTEEEGINE